ncbi:uncharacterized protein TM35_000041120, partial [Trypanosoma theileri]
AGWWRRGGVAVFWSKQAASTTVAPLLFWCSTSCYSSFLVVRSLCVVVLLRLGGVRRCPGPSRTCPCGGVGPPPLPFFLGAVPSGFCRCDLRFLRVLVVVALLFAAPRVALWLRASASHWFGWAGPGAGFWNKMPLAMRAAFICRQGVEYMNLMQRNQTHSLNV